MNLHRALLLFLFLVFTVACSQLFFWLLNQKSDYLLILAGLNPILYGYIIYKTKAFTKNPFKK